MRTTIKKRLAKGTLAAAFAFVTLLGTLQYGKAGGSLTAHASCNHHCRHYSSFSSWEQVDERIMIDVLTPIIIRTELQTEYDTCSNCGYKKYYATHCRRVNVIATPIRGTNAYNYYRYIEVVC